MDLPFFAYSLPIVSITSSGDAPYAPVSNATSDEPNLLWKSSAADSVYIIAQVTDAADTVALLFSNARATDLIRVRAGATADETVSNPTYDSGDLPAYTGTKASMFRTKSIITLPSQVAGPFWRIDITAPGHPDGYVSASRLLIGQRMDLKAGIDWDCQQQAIPTSVINSGPGWTTAQAYPTLPGWKVTSSWIDDDEWNDVVYPFLMKVGNAVPVLFTPDINSRVQHQAIYGRIITGPAVGSNANKDNWQVELSIQGLTS